MDVRELNPMPTSKRLMDVAIAGMIVLDLVLTVVFVTRHRRSQARWVERQTVAAEMMGNKVPASQTVAASNPSDAPTAMFLLLRQNDISGPQPFLSPSANARKWDYGGGTNTSHNSINWNGTAADLPKGFHLNSSVAAASATASDLPTQPIASHDSDVNAAMLLLIRAGGITSEIIDCPSTQPTKYYGRVTRTSSKP